MQHKKGGFRLSLVAKKFRFKNNKQGERMEVLLLLVTLGTISILFLGLFLILEIGHNQTTWGLAFIGVISYIGFMVLLLGVVQRHIII